MKKNNATLIIKFVVPDYSQSATRLQLRRESVTSVKHLI